MNLTDPDFIRKLESLYLLARHARAGILNADHKSVRKGAGIIFSDYHEYSHGDDYRAIDWGIYARMDQLMTRLFEVEEDTHIYLFLDQSISMVQPFDLARQITAALGYICLNQLDRLAVFGIGQTMVPLLELSHGRGKTFSLLRALTDAACEQHDSCLNEMVRQFLARRYRKGIAILVSDFFFPDGYADALARLQWAGFDVCCIQTLDESVLSCDWKGDINLTCAETGMERTVTIGPSEQQRYRQAVATWNDALQGECARRGFGFIRAMNGTPFDEILTGLLRSGKVST